MKTVPLICILVVLTLSSAFAAPEWKPYDDFEGDLDAIEETPGQIPDLGTKWVQFVPENRLEMGIKDGTFQMKVKSPGGRDPGFKLVFGWEPRDILGIQFTVKVAELSEAGGWFGVLCTNEEPNWKNPNWVFGMSPSHQHNWGAQRRVRFWLRRATRRLGSIRLRGHPRKYKYAQNAPLGVERCEA